VTGSKSPGIGCGVGCGFVGCRLSVVGCRLWRCRLSVPTRRTGVGSATADRWWVCGLSVSARRTGVGCGLWRCQLSVVVPPPRRPVLVPPMPGAPFGVADRCRLT